MFSRESADQIQPSAPSLYGYTIPGAAPPDNDRDIFQIPLPDNFMREEKELHSLIKVNCINVGLNIKGITLGTVL